MSENHNRPTKHKHSPYTCQWLGCKGIDAIIAKAFKATEEAVENERGRRPISIDTTLYG